MPEFTEKYHRDGRPSSEAQDNASREYAFTKIVAELMDSKNPDNIPALIEQAKAMLVEETDLATGRMRLRLEAKDSSLKVPDEPITLNANQYPTKAAVRNLLFDAISRMAARVEEKVLLRKDKDMVSMVQ